MGASPTCGELTQQRDGRIQCVLFTTPIVVGLDLASCNTIPDG